jgi:hypothetical protein
VISQQFINQSIQLLGEAVALVVVLERVANLIRDWRGGSPELRLIRDQLKTSNEQLKTSNDRLYGLVERIASRLDEGR